MDGEDGLTLRHPQRGEVQLRGVAAAVWRHLDGARSPGELAAAVGAEADAVWAALDELGDAELLTGRVTPPAGVHENVRREVVFVAETVAASDAEGAAKLEAQFDAGAAKADQDIVLPQAEERRKQQEAARATEEAAAAAVAMAEFDSRPEDADTKPSEEVAASAEEVAAQPEDAGAKQEPAVEVGQPVTDSIDASAQPETPAESAGDSKTAD